MKFYNTTVMEDYAEHLLEMFDTLNINIESVGELYLLYKTDFEEPCLVGISRNANKNRFMPRLLEANYFHEYFDVLQEQTKKHITNAEDWVRYFDNHEDLKEKFEHEYVVMEFISDPELWQTVLDYTIEDYQNIYDIEQEKLKEVADFERKYWYDNLKNKLNKQKVYVEQGERQ